MPTTATLNAVLRQERGKGPARRLRRAGRVPAVIYGHGEQTRSLALDGRELERLFSHIRVENTIITLTIAGETRAPVRALVREVQMHPFRPEVVHVDFLQVHAGKRVYLEIPVRLAGAAAGVKTGGILQQTLHEIEVRCLPDQIPESLEIDVSGLEVGDSLHVSDLRVPESVEVETDGDRVLCTVLAPTVAAVEPTAEEPEGPGGDVEPELIRRRGEEGEQPEAAE